MTYHYLLHEQLVRIVRYYTKALSGNQGYGVIKGPDWQRTKC